jgi:hypothetical protein
VLNCYEKITNDEKTPMTRFRHWLARFQILFPNSGDGGWNSAAMATFQLVSQEFGLVRLDSREIGQILVMEAGIWQ